MINKILTVITFLALREHMPQSKLFHKNRTEFVKTLFQPKVNGVLLNSYSGAFKP